LRRTTGKWVNVGRGGGAYRAFVPAPLPPHPELRLDRALSERLAEAETALARLDVLTALLPDVSLFVYAYIRKEALTSSQIEGTQSSYSNLLLYESDLAPGVPLEDVREVSDYVASLEVGLDRLRSKPVWSPALVCELHRVLMRRGRSAAKSPGHLRRSLVWIGGPSPQKARFVPPPADEVPHCVRELTAWLGSREGSPLIRAALAHVQFETIHPFRDGNGRLGRMLITLLLCTDGLLSAPLLYLSLFFKDRRREYYDLLQAVRLEGDWEGWLRFFLEGVIETAGEATLMTRRTLALFDRDRRRIAEGGTTNMLRVFEALQRHPLRAVRDIERELTLTFPTAAAALAGLEQMGIVHELTGQKRNRLYAYRAYVELLNEGTEPL
jgi:Fic family protein